MKISVGGHHGHGLAKAIFARLQAEAEKSEDAARVKSEEWHMISSIELKTDEKRAGTQTNACEWNDSALFCGQRTFRVI